jgi:hypothetical protein
MGDPMSSVVISGDTSGSVTLDAPAISGNTVLTLPTASGTILTTAGGATVPFALGSAGAPSITFTGDTNTGIFSPGADSIGFAEGGAEVARFDSSGTFIVGPFGGNGNAVLAGSSSPSFTNQPGTNLLLKSGDGSGTGSSFMSFWTSPTGSSGTTVNTAAERMRIDSSGNVSIGTASPATRFHVNQGNVSADTYIERLSWGDSSGTNKGLLGFFSNNGADTRGFIGADNSGTLFLGENGGGGIRFLSGGPSGSERMRIDTSGRLLVGTTSVGNAVAWAAIRNGGSGSVVLQIQRSGDNPSYIGTDNATPFAVWDSGIVQRFAVTSAGSCQNTTGSYGTLSDAKLKENIVDATPKLDDLMQVKVRNYGLKSEPNSKFIGFVAQELREVFPAMIEESLDEDESGEKTGEVTLSVKTTVLIPILVKAIQELNAKVIELEAKLESK